MEDRRSIAHKKLQGLIDKGRTQAAEVINRVMTEVPQDRIVRAQATKFEPTETGVEIITPDKARLGLHRNAVYQVSTRAGIPVSYVDSLNEKGAWGRELLAHSLNQLFSHQDKETRYLVRSINKQARAVLSDSYMRLDSRPIVEAFTSSLQKVGALPYDGYALDTRIAIQAILPEIYEPLPGELIAFGGTLQNSDFGNGALAFNVFGLRLVCINGAIGQDMMHKVHLGRRLADDVVYSQQTYELDTQTMISAIRDTVKYTLGGQFVKGYLDSIKQAGEEKLAPKEVPEILKRHLNKAQIAKVLEAYNGADVEMLPAGNTQWRLSNAISWVAGATEDREEKLELQKVAGAVLPALAKAA